MRGFTLLELMTTLAIFSLVATLSVASLGPMRDRYAHDQAVQMVVATGVRTRHLSRDASRCHVIDAGDASGNTLAAGFDGDRLHIQRRLTADCDSAQPTAAIVQSVEWVRLPRGMEVQVSTGKAEWRPNGRLQTDAVAELTVKMKSTNRQTIVRFLPQGTVCVVQPNGACL
jgi:prepilin-type N-terminal cleavage/methylation domain-containing protein